MPTSRNLHLLLCALAATLLALSACAQEGELADMRQGPPFVFNITALPADVAAVFVAAGGNWNTKTGEELIVIDDDGPNDVIVAALPDGVKAATIHHGDGTVTIVVAPHMAVFGATPALDLGDGVSCSFEKRAEALFEHEIGHVFGAFFPDNPSDPIHSPISDDIMHILPPGCGDLTTRDVESIRW